MNKVNIKLMILMIFIDARRCGMSDDETTLSSDSQFVKVNHTYYIFFSQKIHVLVF